MNLILLTDDDYIADGTVCLRDRRFEQIKNIHGSKLGDSVRLGNLGGLMGLGVIQSLDNSSVVLTVVCDEKPPAKLPITIVLALPRPKMIRRIFRTVAELGVEELIIINSYKVEKSYWQSPALNPENIHHYFIDGLQQAKDTVLPRYRFYQRFKPFVEDHFPAVIENKLALLAHPNLGQSCDAYAQFDHCVIVIGPEGGFTDYEVQKFQDAGCQGVNLGDRILKVENALITLVAKLSGNFSIF